MDDQEAFKHGEWFWFLLAFLYCRHSSIFGPPPTKNEEICIQTLNSSNIDNDIHAKAGVDEMDTDNDDKDDETDDDDDNDNNDDDDDETDDDVDDETDDDE